MSFGAMRRASRVARVVARADGGADGSRARTAARAREGERVKGARRRRDEKSARADAASVAALRRWLRAHGATVDESLTTFATSGRYGVAGVALRDADEGEVRRDGRETRRTRDARRDGCGTGLLTY